jgi:hypothetical protein
MKSWIQYQVVNSKLLWKLLPNGLNIKDKFSGPYVLRWNWVSRILDWCQRD